MAFRGYEINLMLRVQDRATTRLRRIAADLGGVGRAADLANLATANQVAVQTQIVRSAENIAKVQNKVDVAERRIAQRRSILAAQRASENAALAQSMQRISDKEITAKAARERKLVQIANTEAMIQRRATGSSAIRQAMQIERLSARQQVLANQRLSLLDRTHKVQARINTLQGAEATLIAKAGARKIENLSTENLQRIAAGNYHLKQKAIANQLLANRNLLAAAKKEQAQLPALVKAWQASLATVSAQEALILAQIDEQAQALERADLLLKTQKNELLRIEGRLATIAAEWDKINADETLSNEQHAARLALLNSEAAALGRQKVLLGEMIAEHQILINQTLAEAAAADLAAVATERREQSIQRTNLLSRRLIHGGSVALMAGALGVGASAGAGAAFAGFNREALAAATQMRGVNASFAETIEIARVLESGILSLTREFPASASEMAQSIYDIASGMDIQIDRTSKLTETQQRYAFSMRLLRAANQVAVAGQIDLRDATNSLLVVFNNFDPQVKRSSEIVNTLFSIVRFGKGTFAEFAPVFGRMAAAANAAGQSLTEAGGAVAFLSQRLNQTQAVTAYLRIMQIMGRREFTEGFKDIFKVSATEVTADGVERLKQLSEIIGIITTRAPQLAEGGVRLQNFLQDVTARGQDIIAGTAGHKGLVSTQQARIAIANLVHDNETYADVLSNVRANTTEFDEALKAMGETPGVRFQVAVNQFKAFAIVFGERVLPEVIKVFDKVGELLHRFGDLSPRTREIIGQFTVWGSVLLAVGGFLSMVVGGIVGVLSRLGLLTSTGEGTVGVFRRLLFVLGRLAAIGAIAIIIKTMWTGDADAKDLLKGALLGAAAGFTFGGPLGAAIGAITVPVVIELSKKPPDPSKMAPVVVAYQAYLKKMFKLNMEGQIIDFAEFERKWKGHIAGLNKVPFAVDALERNRDSLHNLENANAQATRSIADEWRDLAAELGGINVFKTLIEQAANAVVEINVQLAKAGAFGDVATQDKLLRQLIAIDKFEAARIEKLPKTAKNQKLLIELYNDIGTKIGQLNALYNEEAKSSTTLAETRAGALKSALEQQENDIDQYVNTLIQKFKELENANNAAFGSLLEGPIMGGPIVQMFKNLNQTLQGLGQKPIPIPFQFVMQDLRIQKANFDQFRNTLATLAKRGVPKEMLDELQAKGTAALPELLSIATADQGQLKEYIKIWQEGKAARDAATQADMDSTLKLWMSYGKDIAWHIIQGLSDSKTQATLREGYKTWVVSTFKDELAQGIAQSVSEAVQEFNKSKAGKTTGGRKEITAKDIKPQPVPVSASPKSKTKNTDSQGLPTHSFTVHADGATPEAVKSAYNRAMFERMHR